MKVAKKRAIFVGNERGGGDGTGLLANREGCPDESRRAKLGSVARLE